MSPRCKGTCPYPVTTQQTGTLARKNDDGREETERMEFPKVVATVGMDPVEQMAGLMGQVLQQQQQQSAWQLVLEERWIQKQAWHQQNVVELRISK